jgi:hypothetical protein
VLLVNGIFVFEFSSQVVNQLHSFECFFEIFVLVEIDNGAEPALAMFGKDSLDSTFGVENRGEGFFLGGFGAAERAEIDVGDSHIRGHIDLCDADKRFYSRVAEVICYRVTNRFFDDTRDSFLSSRGHNYKSETC